MKKVQVGQGGEIVGFPDTMTDAEILAQLRKNFMKVAEPAAAMVTGAVAEPISGLAGLGALALGGNADQAADKVRAVQEWMTYVPRTEEGQKGLQAVADVLQPVANAMEWTSKSAGDYVFEKTGSEELAAIAYAAPTAALEAIGLKVGAVPLKAAGLDMDLELGDIGTSNKQAGIFGGIRGAKFDEFPQAEQAKQMLDKGENPIKVWRETGWMRGADGNMRFEIDDSKAELQEIKSDLKTVSSEDMERGFIEQPSTVKASEIIKHDELFDRYPELADYDIFFGDDTVSWGGIHYSSGLIGIREDLLKQNPERAKEILIHELQHAVQHQEDFARGGSDATKSSIEQQLTLAEALRLKELKAFERQIKDSPVAADAEKAAGLARDALMYQSAQRLIDYANSSAPTRVKRNIQNESGWVDNLIFDYDPSDPMRKKLNDLQRNWYNLPKRHKKAERTQFLRDHAFDTARTLLDVIGSDRVAEFKADKRKLQSMVNALSRDSAKKGAEKRAQDNKLSGLKSSYEKAKSQKMLSPYETYLNLAGEVESRLAESRVNMTAEERRLKFPEQPTNQIVLTQENDLVSFDADGKADLIRKNYAVDEYQPNFSEAEALPMDYESRMARAKEQGYNEEAFHGTTHNFDRFEDVRLEPESHFGKGYYFSTDIEDVNRNYAGRGADLTSRIDRMAEQIENDLADLGEDDIKDLSERYNLDFDPENETYPEDLPQHMAAEELQGSEGLVMPVLLKTDNLFDLTKSGYDKSTFLEYEREIPDWREFLDEAEGDEDLARDLAQEASWDNEPTGRLADFIDSIFRQSQEMGFDPSIKISAIMEAAESNEGISAQILDDIMRGKDGSGSLYAEDPETGAFMDNEVYRQALEDAGFEGVRHRADTEFPNMGIPEGTEHIIMFKPHKIRSVHAKFDPKNLKSGEILAGGAAVAGIYGQMQGQQEDKPRFMIE